MVHADWAVKLDHYALNETWLCDRQLWYAQLSQQQQKFKHKPFKFIAVKMNSGHLQSVINSMLLKNKSQSGLFDSWISNSLLQNWCNSSQLQPQFWYEANKIFHMKNTLWAIMKNVHHADPSKGFNFQPQLHSQSLNSSTFCSWIPLLRTPAHAG